MWLRRSQRWLQRQINLARFQLGWPCSAVTERGEHHPVCRWWCGWGRARDHCSGGSTWLGSGRARLWQPAVPDQLVLWWGLPHHTVGGEGLPWPWTSPRHLGVSDSSDCHRFSFSLSLSLSLSLSHTHTHTHTHTHAHAPPTHTTRAHPIHTYTCTHTPTCMHTPTSTHASHTTCTHAHTHTHTDTHTHTHTHTWCGVALYK